MSPAPTPARPTRARQRILIVDDDITMRVLAREALEQAGFTVEEAADGSEALESFARRRPDAILLDVQMPELDGFETCSKLRTLPGGDHAPILMMTGLDDPVSINRAYEAGATDFITKPIPWPMLGHRMRYLLRANRAFTDLARSQERLLNAQRIAQLGHWEWNLETNDVQCSDEVFRMIGLTPEAFRRRCRSFVDLVHPEDRPRVEAALQHAIGDQQPLNIDCRIVQPDGTVRVIHQQAELWRDPQGKALRLHGTAQDITERTRAAEQIRQLALYDSLTGLPNRDLFREQLNHAIAHAKRSASNLVTLSLNLDRFKRVNDTLGRRGGDLLLKEAAKRISSSLRPVDYVTRDETIDALSDSLARPGGDEFTLFLALKDPSDAAKVARRILWTLAHPFSIEGNDIVVSASIGVAAYPLDGDDAETLLKNADAAMHYAKDHGKNNYQFYNDGMNATAFQRMTLESSLHRALERDEFGLFYQPKLDLVSGAIVGAEALIRWRHPEMGLVSPAAFIPLAEESGLIVPIGEWVIRTACLQIRAWRDAGIAPIPVAVNISAKQFAQRNLTSVLTRILTECEVPPHLIEVEITESTAMHNVEETSATLRQLKSLGVTIAIDDFGTGYSSLGYLKRFPIDSLKIDRSFVTGLPGDQDDASIAQAVITMAHALRLKVVAEGVEKVAQHDFLAANGCDEMQGYYFSPPVPAEDCTRMLKAAVGLSKQPLLTAV